MKVYDMPQGSPEWFEARAGIPTASELDSLVTPLGAARKGEGVETYLARKVAERWTGSPLITFSGGGAMEQGSIKEDMAVPFFTLMTGRAVRRVGFVTTDDGRLGCSPDGLLDDGTGIEIKCPEAQTHVRYLMAGDLPKEYAAQVHGSMVVTGAPSWTFMSFHPQFPPLVVTAWRNEQWAEAIGQAARDFNRRADESFRRLVELNGGEPAKGRRR